MNTLTVKDGTAVNRLLVAVGQEDSLAGYRILEMPTGFPALVKELAWRAVAADASKAGRPWQLHMRRDERAEPTGPVIVMEARTGADAALLAVLPVPARNFGCIADAMARELNMKGTYQFYVQVLSSDDPFVGEWDDRRRGDADFEIVADTGSELVLPGGFTASPGTERRTVDPADGDWLRCVFTAGAFGEFIAAAETEHSVERHWAGAGHVELSDGVYRAVIERLVELPAEAAGKAWVVTRGRDWSRCQAGIGDALVAYLHLHPREIETRPIRPAPSSNDAVIAWNIETSTPNLAVYPIALFGATADAAAGDVAAHGYVNGLLKRIPLEVTHDE